MQAAVVPVAVAAVLATRAVHAAVVLVAVAAVQAARVVRLQ